MNTQLKNILRRTPFVKKIFQKLDDLRMQIDDLIQTNSHLNTSVTNLTNEGNQLKHEINELKSKITKMLPSPVSSEYDEFYLAPDVPLSKLVSHKNWQKYLYETWNKPDMNILEIGSREVTGKSEAKKEFSKANYNGFDLYPGGNVDMVGDAHQLSSYFAEDEKFDLIYSSACFEHFAMPWVVAREISKMLKIGGIVFIETHFSYSSHERPWHFFQFSDQALRVLFSSKLGFECIETGMSNPIVGRFSSLADEYLKNKPVTGLYCHTEYLGKKIKEADDTPWEEMNLSDVIGESRYPEPAPKL